MGVYLLRSYTEQQDLFKPVSLPLHSPQGGKPRVVVFDAAGALRTFLRPSKRGLLYDFHHQQSRVRSLVKAFRQAGFDLVVFLDLSIPSDKLTTWYRRRVVDASTVRKLNQQLAAAPAAKPNLPDGLWIPPNSCVQLLGDAFVEAGCRVFYSFDDTDKEAAHWAKQNRAHAIITDDTDFLCYEGVDRIWSANIKLPSSRPTPGKSQSIRVSELQRKQLLSSLGLTQVQLQQLAGLLGNDHIKHIAKEKVQQLREAHPGEHVVAVLAKQVLQLQLALGGKAPAANGAFVALHGPVLPEVQGLVAAAVKAVGGADPAAAAAAAAKKAAAAAAAAATANGDAGPAAAAATNHSINGHSAADRVDPIVARLVARSVARVVTAAEAGLDLEDLNEADLDAFLEGEEFEVGAPEEGGKDAEDEAAAGDEAGAGGSADGPAAGAGAAGAGGVADGPAAGAGGSGGGSGGGPAASQVERCKRAMAQYSLEGVAAPVSAGSGDRWLLQQRHTLMKAVGLEDLSKTPAHVLLQPLRLAVYSALGLSSVTEYMCVPDEQWRSWAMGRLVEVPTLPARRERRGKARDKSGRGGGGGGEGRIDPGVRRIVAAVFANVLAAATPGGAAAAPAAEEDGKEDKEAAGAEQEPAAEEEEGGGAGEAAAASAEGEAAADAAAAAADEEDDGIDPVVRKLVSGAMAKAVVAANRAAAKAAKAAAPFEALPKPLPAKPLELATLLLRRLRQVDRAEEQFTKTHEKLLLLQVSHRNSLLNALRSAHAGVNAVRLPDLHAANLFLQAYAMLHISADGKLPRITTMLHVEGFHALCQHPDLVTKVQAGPSDAELAKQANRGGASGGAAMASAAAAAAVAGVGGGRGGFRGPKPGMGGPGGRVPGGPFSGQGPYNQQQPRGGGFRGGPGGPRAGPGGRGEGGPGHGLGGRGHGPGFQQRGEPLTWQQRQARGPQAGGGPPHGGPALHQQPQAHHQPQWYGGGGGGGQGHGGQWAGYGQGQGGPAYGSHGGQGGGGAAGYGGAGGQQRQQSEWYGQGQGAAGYGSHGGQGGSGAAGYGGASGQQRQQPPWYGQQGQQGGASYAQGGQGGGSSSYSGAGSQQRQQPQWYGQGQQGGAAHTSHGQGGGSSGYYHSSQGQGGGGSFGGAYAAGGQQGGGSYGYGGGWSQQGGGHHAQGAPGRGGPPGGRHGAPPHSGAAPGAPHGGGGGGGGGDSGLTWQQQQMVSRQPRGPPQAAPPARQGSGSAPSWQ